MADRPLLYVLEHFAVAVNAIAGVLAARGRHIDLFGVIVLALVTAFGGGTMRDMCLGSTPVFWIRDSNYIVTVLVAAVFTFFLARKFEPPRGFMEISDSVGLAMFTIIGAQKGLTFGTGAVIAVAMGTMTGVAGGIVRDVLLNELPLVFRNEIKLYATAAISGAVVFVILSKVLPPGIPAAIAGETVTLAVRLLAIHWEIKLPLFRTKD
ncbi:MAG: trimeric intracellular cation channel family protein [Luteolibacter sp.]